VRLVHDQPAESVVGRRADLAAASDAGIDNERLVAWLASRGRLTVYTPDTSLAAAPPPLIRPHLWGAFRHARARGIAAGRSGGRSLSVATALSLLPTIAALVGAILLLMGGIAHALGVGLLLGYVVALLASGVHAAARFRSLPVGLLEPPAVVASQLAYVAGFLSGLMRPE
jgi:hypothetical protein